MRNAIIRDMFRPTHVSNAMDVTHLIGKQGLRYARLKMITSGERSRNILRIL